MHLTKVAFLFSSLAGLAAVHAAPTTTSDDIDPNALFEPADGLQFLQSQDSNGTTLYWFGETNSTNTTSQPDDSGSDLQRRCGSNRVICYNSHIPSSPVCRYLLEALASNHINVPNNAARSLCVTQDGGNCCTSWANPVSGLVTWQLYNGAKLVNDQCVQSFNLYKQSGLVRDISLAGTCTTQCLSDRPKGCS